MANMSYCRFENTAKDLDDCARHLFDILSESEAKAREEIIRLCIEILKDSNLTGVIESEIGDAYLENAIKDTFAHLWEEEEKEEKEE